MTITGEPRRIIGPQDVRAGHNGSGADLAKNIFIALHPAGTEDPDQIQLPTLGGQVYGVTLEIIKNAQNGDVQVKGRAVVLAGTGGVAVGQKLSATAAGAAIPAVTGQQVVAMGATAGAAGDLVEVELVGPLQTLVMP